MKVAQAISRALVSEGVTLAAGIAGQSIWPVIDAIGDCEEVTLMYARQERVAFDICDGFARASGNPAVVFTDAGPAAANLMGGIVNSWGDSVPVLFLAGHNDRTKMASKYTKEIPFLEIFGPVSKWAAMIDDPSKVGETLRRAFMHMRTGRPGPVALGVPLDVAQMEVGNFEYVPVSPRPRVRGGADPEAVKAAVEMIAGAERPYVYVGAGVLFSEASEELVRFAELLTLPVATTLNGKSAFPENHRACARHRRFRPRVLFVAAGHHAGGKCRRDPHHRLRLQAACHGSAPEPAARSTSRSTSIRWRSTATTSPISRSWATPRWRCGK